MSRTVLADGTVMGTGVRASILAVILLTACTHGSGERARPTSHPKPTITVPPWTQRDLNDSVCDGGQATVLSVTSSPIPGETPQYPSGTAFRVRCPNGRTYTIKTFVSLSPYIPPT
jgi:hypothetical protein